MVWCICGRWMVAVQRLSYGTRSLKDVKSVGASALALVQGIADSDSMPAKGVYFVTRGAQVLGTREWR